MNASPSPEPMSERPFLDSRRIRKAESTSVTLTLGDAELQELAQLVAEILDDAAVEREDGVSGGWPEWMSVETAARYLDVSEERVRKLKDRGEIPHYQEGPGCRIFFCRAELDEWMGSFRQGRLYPRTGAQVSESRPRGFPADFQAVRSRSTMRDPDPRSAVVVEGREN